MPDAVFVYGTLKQGQVRAKRWPHPPRRVELALITGRLHDLGPYPALLEGTDTVLGEVWSFRPEEMSRTLRVLDEIECYGIDEVDLYERRVVEGTTLSGERFEAYTYFLADPRQAAGSPVVKPDERGWVWWEPRRRLSGNE